MDKNVKKLIRSTSLVKGIDPKVGEAIISSLFKQFKEVAEQGDLSDEESFKNFRIINFGLLYSEEANRKRILKRNEILKRKKNDSDEISMG